VAAYRKFKSDVNNGAGAGIPLHRWAWASESCSCRSNAVKTRHPYVHEDDVRSPVPGEVDGAAAVLRLADNDQVVGSGDDAAETHAHQRLVVGDEDADRHAGRVAVDGICRTAVTSKPPPNRGPALRSPPYNAARSRMPTSP